MNCYLIMVGSELLNGMMVDTNSCYMAEELNKYGIEIKGKMVVGDKWEEIKEAIDFAAKKADLVLMSGGLGPTIDDITRDVVADYFNKKLVLNEEKFELIKERYKNIFKGELPERNIRQAMFPEDAVIIDNKKGAAASFFIEKVACFPGVPIELKDCLPKFLDYYKEIKNLRSQMYIKDIIVWGLPESEIERQILDIVENSGDVFVEFLVKNYGILVRFICQMEFKAQADTLKERIYERVGDFIIGEDNDRIENLLFKALVERKMTFSAAESCTGGLISSIMASISGISMIFMEGMVTYSNNAKIERLGVSKETLNRFGAVSKETVEEMVKGLKTVTGVAVSGIAGPSGGTLEKPVGTVYISVRVNERVKTERFNFFGDRDKIRERASLTALNELRKLLLQTH